MGHVAFTGRPQSSKPATQWGHFELETLLVCELPVCKADTRDDPK